jgi:hypothetical protein
MHAVRTPCGASVFRPQVVFEADRAPKWCCDQRGGAKKSQRFELHRDWRQRLCAHCSANTTNCLAVAVSGISAHRRPVVWGCTHIFFEDGPNGRCTHNYGSLLVGRTCRSGRTGLAGGLLGAAIRRIFSILQPSLVASSDYAW